MNLSILKAKRTKLLAKVAAVLMSTFFVGVSYASLALATGTPAPVTSINTLTALQKNIGATGNSVIQILLVIFVIAGIILVAMGIMHLKQNYTGTGQEKHLAKGLACLGFGAALFIVVPITHALVGGITGGASQYNTWQVASSAGNISQ